jgi:hypothetical protein
MECAIIEGSAVERGDVGAAASGDIAVFPNLAVIMPAAFGPDIGKEHIFRFRFVEDPKGAP